MSLIVKVVFKVPVGDLQVVIASQQTQAQLLREDDPELEMLEIQS